MVGISRLKLGLPIVNAVLLSIMCIVQVADKTKIIYRETEKR